MAEIGLHARKLKDDTIKRKGVAIKSPYCDRPKCEALKEEFGGRWKPEKSMWVYPLRTRVVDRAEELWKNGNLYRSDLLDKWYEEEIKKKTLAISAKNQDVSPEDLEIDWADRLYQFQRNGVNFLKQVDGAILGDAMGTGKTVQALATAQEKDFENILVVCPNSLKLNWKNEIEKWLPEEAIRTIVLSGSKGKRLNLLDEDSKFTIVNYASIRQKVSKKVDGEYEKVDNKLFNKMHDQDWDCLILDEAHKCRNRKSQQTKAVKKLASEISSVYQLTGTPIQNAPEEIWSLLNILDSKKFSSFWRFVTQYCHIRDNYWGKEIGRAKNPKEFRRLLKPYMLRRRKEEVLDDLPEITREKRWVELKKSQQEVYNQMQKEMVAKLSEKEKVTAPVVIAKMTRLKQIAVSPKLLSEEWEGNTAKFQALDDIVKGTDQKLAVFSQFKTAIKLVKDWLDEKDISYNLIHGDITGEDRQSEIDQFQQGKSRIFLATIGTGGLGINLTEASIGIFLDKKWNPAQNQQVIDRLHRIGQENNVTIIELLAKNTIEEYVESILQRKQETFDRLIEGKVSGKELLLNLKDEMER